VKKQRVLICGTPGTGKSSTFEKIKETNPDDFDFISIVELCKKKKIVKKHEVDIKKLEKILTKEIQKMKKTVILEGHLGCELKNAFDVIIILRSDPKILEKRLSKRKYSSQKILDNLVSEMLDYCTIESEKNNPKAKVIEIRSDKSSIEKISQKIVKMIKLKKFKGERVSFKLEKYKNYISRDVL
jgi:adenylate kinase